MSASAEPAPRPEQGTDAAHRPQRVPHGPPRRERVTGEPRGAGVASHAHKPVGDRLPGHRTQWEIDEQTTLGAAYVRSLIRSQLRTGLAAFALLALPVVTLPLFFGALRNATVVWSVLGFCCYPLLVLIAWWYVRRAEANERDFARLVRGTDHPAGPQ